MKETTMVEVKYRSDKGGPEERIRARLKNSGGEEGYTVHTGGDAPNRVFHNVHEKGNVQQRGGDAKGEGNIHGEPRGSNNPHGEI
jgi:hypothetical protein